MKYSMFIGGYGPQSIHRVTLRDGKLKCTDSFSAENASYLCLSENGRHLYAVGETQKFRGEPSGSVQSYDLSDLGKPTLTSVQATGGMYPCHLTIAGNLLVISNYGTGSLSRFRLNDDGTLAEALPLIEHEPDARPGQNAHAHQAQLTPAGYLAVSDLGLDTVYFYPAKEIAADAPQCIRVNTPAGFGPRHCIFPKGLDTWYVLCELRSELLVYRGAPSDAVLVGRSPIGSRSGNAPAALRQSPDGRLLAATGRGENIITLFSVSEHGLLARLTEMPSMGDWPRDVQFSPDGKFLVCANQRSNSLTAFAIENGHLEYCSSVHVPAPACVLFHQFNQEES